MNKTGLVALIVLAIASLLMIFVIMPNLDQGKAPETAATAPAVAPTTPAAPGTPASPGEASAPPAPSSAPQPEASQAATAEPAAPPAAPAPTVGNDQASATAPSAGTAGQAPAAAGSQAAAKGARPSAPDATASAEVPSFDVLRVEPDGSTVIAGRATPKSKLEIINGQTVLGTADATATGDFAAVFDQPLPPGDYQITLRATAPDGKTSASEEVATVSVPRTANGELLAMVSKPGEASRIITAPGLAGQAAAATAQPDAGAAAPADQAALGAAAANQAPAGTPAPAAGGSAAAETSSAPTGNAPGQVGPAGAQISVTAVELEGDRIFVAGTARPGSTVRIYADDTFVGEAKADAAGRFIVEGRLAISVGQHIIRADMLGPDGVKVQMRAAVPFERPEGDQVAAVAAPATGSAAGFDGPAFDAARIEASKAFSLLKGLYAEGRTPNAEQMAAARSATEFALTSLSNIKVEPGVDDATRGVVEASTKAARDALAILRPLPRDVAAVGRAIPQLEAALAAVLRPDAATAASPIAAAPSAGAGSVGTTGAAAPANAQSAEATTPAAPAAGASAEPQTVQQAPLQQSRSSVIIRRGDTLWQISRRVYGAGVRYTTIYVANEEQIADPDRILPGQIFGVPDKALPDAESEEIHRRHLKQVR